jgi:hypothetical protein
MQLSLVPSTWLHLPVLPLTCLCQATARLVEYVPGGFGRTAALMHIKANAEEDMQLTDSRIAGDRERLQDRQAGRQRA